MTLQNNTVPGIERLARPAPQRGNLYPPGATNANWFGLLNAVSWYISLGAPLILYATSLGASATVLGVLAALPPLMVMFQIPAAGWIGRLGYRRFTLAGWGSRSLMVLGIALVPLLKFLPPAGRIGLLVAFLTGFTVLRGLTSGAWLPWMTALIPAEVRGRFLSRDQVFTQLGSLTAMLLSAACLVGDPAAWQYALAFLLSAMAAMLSLVFLVRIPDVTAPEHHKKSAHRVPWKELLFYPPFFRLVCFSVLWVAASGGLGVFVISFLRDVAGYAGSLILVLNGMAVVGALGSLWWGGRLLDRIGSVPVLRWCVLTFAVMVGGWWVLATGVAPGGVVLVALLYLVWGVAGANFTVANAQLVMGTMPLMGRNHFFAIHSVITNVAAGLAPVGWGILLDSIEHVTGGQAQGWLNRFSIYFALVLVGLLATAMYLGRVSEAGGDTAQPPEETTTAPASG